MTTQPETDEETALYRLTADDVAAMRATDSMSFHTGKHGIFIRLYLREYGMNRIYTAREQRLFPKADGMLGRTREIPASAQAHGYGERTTAWAWASDSGWFSGADRDADPPSCFETDCARPVWETITRSLKVGDHLRLIWTADNNSETTKEAGLHVDELRLAAFPARQPERGPQVSSTWNVRVSVCRDNSARMIRRYGN